MNRSLRALLLAGVTSAVSATATTVPTPVLAQVFPTSADEIQEDLLLEADELSYDYATEIVTASGNVQVYYGAYTLTTDRLVYNRPTGQVLAIGNVEIVQPDGSVIIAERADVSETLSSGFVEALSFRTADNTRLAASSAERVDEDTTVLVRGVYTACEPCRENPEKRPTWQIKAGTIVYDDERELVYYRDARLELFGLPIAYLPVFSHSTADDNRKTGFLIPSVGYVDKLGVGITTPFYWNIAPNMDLTLRPTLFSRQGLLADGEFRHRLLNGAYSIRAAGIFQQDPDAFDGAPLGSNQAIDASRVGRGHIETEGRFSINSRWNWGWNGYLMSDRRFLPTYGLIEEDATDVTSEVFLTGLGTRNFFDARMQHFQPLTQDISQSAIPTLHPLVDYTAFFDDPLAGGEFRFDGNITSLTRRAENVTCMNSTAPPPFEGAVPVGSCGFGTASVLGFAGQSTRISGELDWRRRFVSTWGQVITPFASARADAYWLDLDESAFAPAAFPADENAYARFMPTVGVDTQMPFVSDLGWATQTLTPRLQVIARTDEDYIGRLPNEDAQSLVFDTTTLFQHDKFSGFDRAEGGVRANAGLTYTLQSRDWQAEITVGQSYHLAGRNSFATADVVNVGIESGLESDVSDFVGSAALRARNITLDARVRVDEDSLDTKRLEIGAGYAGERFSGNLTYINLAERPALGIVDDRQELTAAAALKLTEHWTVGGGGVFDVDEDYLRSATATVGWADECFDIRLGYSGEYNVDRNIRPDHKLSLSVSLRTIGGGTIERDLSRADEPTAAADTSSPFTFSATPGF